MARRPTPRRRGVPMYASRQMTIPVPSDPVVRCHEWWSNLWWGIICRLVMHAPAVHQRLMLALQEAGLAGPGRSPYLVTHKPPVPANSFRSMARFAGAATWPSARGRAAKGGTLR